MSYVAYDYRNEVKKDVLEAVTYDKEYFVYLFDGSYNEDEIKEILYDKLWLYDSVTGNASGSYTFSKWVAEENLCHNTDLILEAMEDFGCVDYKTYISNPEKLDVLIRCHLLYDAITALFDDIKALYGEKVETV